MRQSKRSPLVAERITRLDETAASLLLAGVAALALSTTADALVITSDFESSITGNANAAQIEGAIDTAIGTIDGLYSPNNVSITVDFSYTPGAPGNLLSTSEEFYGYSYSAYTNALKADSAANPSNTNLATAVANLSKGNDSDGASRMAIAYAQALLLANYGLGAPAFVTNASINIASNQPFDFTRPVPSNQYDAIGGLEHELDEVLGGGGAGSTLNEILNNCTTNPTNFFCGRFGPTDLYRYSAPGTPSFTTSGTASAYLSIDGGLTNIVDFNQNSRGDYGDFAPPGTGPGQLIQNAFNNTGQDEAYTTSSPEFLMEEAIGWDPNPQVVVPEFGHARVARHLAARPCRGPPMAEAAFLDQGRGRAEAFAGLGRADWFAARRAEGHEARNLTASSHAGVDGRQPLGRVFCLIRRDDGSTISAIADGQASPVGAIATRNRAVRNSGNLQLAHGHWHD